MDIPSREHLLQYRNRVIGISVSLTGECVALNPIKCNKLLVITILVLAVLPFDAASVFAEYYPAVYSLENGVKVNIYSPELIIDSMISRDSDGRLVFYPPEHVGYVLVEDVSDPVIVNKGDGSFHPMDTDDILSAVAGIDMGEGGVFIEIDIFVLPLPRRFVPGSTADGMTIFLSPGVLDISYEIAAFTVTHEIGHCIHNRFLLDSDEEGWGDFLALRGILGDSEYSCTSVHANRPKEIFAEDFRFLFGCEAANYSGTIENPELVLPDEVYGLSDYFISLVSMTVASLDEVILPGIILSAVNYPNPFNPSTTIRAEFGLADNQYDVDVKIYNVNGTLVRNLYSGNVSGGQLNVFWDGRSNSGTSVGSGIYFYAIRTGHDMKTGKMLLVK